MPASLELGLQTHLAADAGVAAITTRLWLGDVAPQAEILPDVLFKLVDGSIEETFDGAGEDLQFPIFSFECRHTLPAGGIALATAVRLALRLLATGATIATTAGDVIIEQLCLLGEEDETSTFEAGGKARTLYSRTVLAQIGFRIQT